jgi:hypothetical protein
MQVHHCYIDLQTQKVELHLWSRDGRCQSGENHEAHRCTWTTTLPMPVCSPKRLLPTFCSTLVALRYTLRVRLYVRGMYHSPFMLDVPLQVLSCREGGNARDESISENLYNRETVHDLFGVSGTFQVSCPYIEMAPILLIYHSILGKKHFHLLMITIELGSQKREDEC